MKSNHTTLITTLCRSFSAPRIRPALAASLLLSALFGPTRAPAQLAASPLTLVYPDEIVVECTHPGGAVVTFDITASSTASPLVALSCTPSSGSLFPAGTNDVVCVAQDGAGNTATATFQVVVTGNCSPDCLDLACPDNLTVTLTQGSEIEVDYPEFSATNICAEAAVPVTCFPPSGSLFPVGTTVVQCIASDNGSRVSCQFTVTVLDVTPPRMSRLASITRECEGLFAAPGTGGGFLSEAGAFVAFDVVAIDNADPNPIITCSPPSGSFFPLGTNQVQCVAMDASGNASSNQFSVVVVSGPACEVSAFPGGVAPEPPDNWGFELGLVGWKGTGNAFATNQQPVLDDRIHTQRITGQKEDLELKIGGDYWHEVLYSVGHKGRRWIGTAEMQIFGIAAVNEELTGTLRSKQFVIKKKHINFLLGGGNDLGNLKVELLVETDGPGPQIEQIGGTYYSREDVATGNGEEVMHRLNFNVSDSIGKRAYLRLVDSSTTGHINVDDFRFSDLAPAEQKVRIGDKLYPAVVTLKGYSFDWDAPVWGFADLHTHPMSYLGFGGKIMHGKSYGGLLDLTNCRCSHGGWGTDNECGNYWRELLQMAMDDTGNNAHQYGYVSPLADQYDQYWRWKQFRSWPVFSTVTHQQMYTDWIRRAYDGGLRVMVALCVNNPLLAHAARGDLPGDDRTVAKIQIDALKAWVDADNAYPQYSFVEIAYDPFQLRDIVRRDKLAIIIGSELDDFGNFATNALVKLDNPDEVSKQIVRDEIDRMYDMGVRYIFPIHLMDNPFGGTAIGSDMLNFATKFLMGRPFEVINASANDQVNFNLSDFNHVKINIDGQNYTFDTGLLALVGSLAGAALLPALGPIVGAVADSMAPVAPGSGAAIGAGLGPILTVAMIGALPVLIAVIADSPIPLDIAPLPGNYPSYPDKTQAPHGIRNALGLSDLGRFAIMEMMKRGMMLDVDHMSQIAIDETFGMAESNPVGYPLNSGHNSFRELGIEVNENHRTTQHLTRIRELGGLMGVGWENGPARSFHGSVDSQLHSFSDIDNDCAGTSKTFGQLYLYALEHMHGSHVAFGTDMDGLIPAPGPRFGPQSAFSLPADNNEHVGASDHTVADRAYDIGAQTDGVLYAPKHGKPLATPAFVGAAVDPNREYDKPRTSLGYRYNLDQRDFYAAIRIFYWFKERDEGIGAENQTNFDLEQIKNGLHDSYPNKDRIKRFAFGMIKAVKGWATSSDEEQIAKAVVRNKLYGEGLPAYLDTTQKQVRYTRNRSVWDDYQEIFGGNAPMTRCSTDLKEWDINFEGVAHYGLMPDFLQDLSNVGLKPRDLTVMFRSAEHVAQMWVKTANAADAINHPELHVQIAAGLASGLLNLAWFAEEGDQLEETDNINDPSSWRPSSAEVRIDNNNARVWVETNVRAKARFYRVKKR